MSTPLILIQFFLQSEILSFVSSSSANVFISSSNSHFSAGLSPCAQLALVHDCIPELLLPASHDLLKLRASWLQSCRSVISVSPNTALDVSSRYHIAPSSVSWCHPSPSLDFLRSIPSESPIPSGDFPSTFILLPSAGTPFSYKNSSLIGSALTHPSLSSLSLVISGVGSGVSASQLIECYPQLADRIFPVGFDDNELRSAYSNAIAVVVPSKIEGFGLTVVEAMSQGGTVLCADSPGLREACMFACPTFSNKDPSDLVSWLQLLLHPQSAHWLRGHIIPKVQRRLSLLNPDLFALSLVAQARLASS